MTRIRPRYTSVQVVTNRYIRPRTDAPDTADSTLTRPAGSSPSTSVQWRRTCRLLLHALALLALLMFPVDYGSGGASTHAHSLIQMFMDLSGAGLGSHHHSHSSLVSAATQSDVFSLPGENAFASTQAVSGTATATRGAAAPGSADPAVWVKSAPGSGTIFGLEAHRAIGANTLALLAVVVLRIFWPLTEALSGRWPTPATPPPNTPGFGPNDACHYGAPEAIT